MSTLTVPNSDFTAGTTIVSAQVDANFAAITAWANGNIDQTNFATMTGAVTWAVTTNVLCLSLSSSGTAGIFSASATGVWAASTSGIYLTTGAAQTTGDAGLYVRFTSGSSTIPVAIFENAGTGHCVSITQSAVLAASKAALNVSVSGAQTTGQAAVYCNISSASTSIPGVLINYAGAASGAKAFKITSTTAPSIPAPVMTTAQRDNIAGASEGDEVFNSSLHMPQFRDSQSNWRRTGSLVNVVTKTADYTLTADDDFVLCNTNALTITLPSAATVGYLKEYTIIKIGSDTNVVSLATTSSQTINGRTSMSMTRQYDRITVVSDGSNWRIKSGYVYSHVVVTTGNGHGSTNTKIRRLTTTEVNLGSAITYADSAANGGSWTINETGLYFIGYSDFHSASGQSIGISLNSAELTASVTSMTAANRLAAVTTPAANFIGFCSSTRWLTNGDVIRAHTTGTPDGATALVRFEIVRVA